MINYLIGMIFVFVYCMFVYLLGCAIDNNKHSAPVRFVIGYIVYSVIVGIGGIPIQILKLSWMSFVIYMVLTIILITIFMIYRFKKKKIQAFDGDIKTFIKNYWFLLFISLVLVFISIFARGFYWRGNGGDDGYYITRMATLPYDKNPFSVSSATGILTPTQFLDLRSFNVFELENSVYIYLLRIPSTLFARCFLAMINYFFFACTIYMFASCIIKKMDFNVDDSLIQYSTIIMIFFSMPYYVLDKLSITHMRDLWQNLSANYLGSVLVRSTGFILLLMPFIENSEVNKNNIVSFGLVTFMLMSKSTTAAPIIYLAFLVIALRYLFTSGKRNIFLGVCVLLVCLMTGFVVDLNEKLVSEALNTFLRDASTLLFVPAIIIAITFMFIRKRVYYEINAYLVGAIAFFVLPLINTITLRICSYDFVAGRTFCSILIMLYVFVWIIIFIEVTKAIRIKVVFKQIVLTFLSFALALSAICVRYDKPIENMISEAKIFMHNYNFVPEVFVELSDSINTLQETKDYQLNVLSPDNLNIEGTLFTLSLTLRQFSPRVVSLAAIGRFPQDSIGDFKGWDIEKIDKFNNFLLNPTKENKESFKKIYEKYPINCIISLNNYFDSYLEEFHLKEYKVIKKQGQYFKIYYRY